MAIQTPETPRASPTSAATPAPAPVGADPDLAKFAPINRALFIGMGIGAGIVLSSVTGFLVFPRAFWAFAAFAGFMLAAGTWGVCFVLMLRRGGWQILMNPPARNDRPTAKDETQSG